MSFERHEAVAAKATFQQGSLAAISGRARHDWSVWHIAHLSQRLRKLGPGLQVGVSTDPQSQCIVVWNLISASVWWSAATPAGCLAVDAKSGAFAVALPRELVRRWTHRLPQPQAQTDVAISGQGAGPLL